MCFTNVNEAGIRYRYFMYSTTKCTDFNKNITLNYKKKKKTSVNFTFSFENIHYLHNTRGMEMPWPTCPTHNTEPVQQEDFTSLLVLEEVPGEKITRHNNFLIVCFLNNSSNNMSDS